MTTQYKSHLSYIAIFFSNLIFVSLIQAAELTVEVKDGKGKLLKDTVVYLVGDNVTLVKNTPIVSVTQKRKKFNPLVTTIQAGTSVNFPNQDRVRHHVYSFSPAKKFELKLYSGVPATPVVFDQAGTVVLGCNIHDNMLAFLYIVNTPYFAQTGASGVATLAAIPEGHYQLKVWHYALQKENIPVEQAIDITSNKNNFSVKLDINETVIVSDK